MLAYTDTHIPCHLALAVTNTLRHTLTHSCWHISPQPRVCQTPPARTPTDASGKCPHTLAPCGNKSADPGAADTLTPVPTWQEVETHTSHRVAGPPEPGKHASPLLFPLPLTSRGLGWLATVCLKQGVSCLLRSLPWLRKGEALPLRWKTRSK